MGRLDRIGAFFYRFDRPALAALGGAGGIWFVSSVLLAVVAAGIHPLLDLTILVLHGLGVATIVIAGLLYALGFWKEYLSTKFDD